MQKNSRSPGVVGGSAPEPADGAYNAPPGPTVGWGGETPHSHPIDAAGTQLIQKEKMYGDLRRLLQELQMDCNRFMTVKLMFIRCTCGGLVMAL